MHGGAPCSLFTLPQTSALVTHIIPLSAFGYRSRCLARYKDRSPLILHWAESPRVLGVDDEAGEIDEVNDSGVDCVKDDEVDAVGDDGVSEVEIDGAERRLGLGRVEVGKPERVGGLCCGCGSAVALLVALRSSASSFLPVNDLRN